MYWPTWTVGRQWWVWPRGWLNQWTAQVHPLGLFQPFTLFIDALELTLLHDGSDLTSLQLCNQKKRAPSVQLSSIAQLCPTLQPHESQHTRPPCPSPTPGVHSDSCPSSQWCHPAISSSVIPFSSCPQSLPASVFSNESTLRMRWPTYWSFSFSIIPSKEIPGLISLQSKGLLRVFCNTTV